MNKKEYLLFSAIVILLLIEFILFVDLPFFWDGISKANRATWIYDTNFSSLILPTEYASGHPPLWIVSLAVFWQFFGKTLFASRLLLLLVNVGVFYQLLLLCKRSFIKMVPIFLFFIVCLEPTLIAQTTSLNNDMMLLFFTLFAINALLKNKWLLLTLALSGLLLTNLRGIYCFIAIIIIHIIYTRKNLLVFNKKMIFAYVVSVIAFGVFLIYQYNELGWVLITKNETYASHRETASFFRIAKNTAAYIKNFLDFGRLAVIIPLLVLLFKVFRSKKQILDHQSKQLLIALLVFTVVFFLGFVPFSNPMGPRYLLICFILANILFINLLFAFHIRTNIKKGLLSLVVIAFVSGHFWIYPATISQAWDSSLAYLNYYKQEEKMLQYLSENDLSHQIIGTNVRLNSKSLSRLEKPTKEFEMFPELNLQENKYVIFSNIENKTSDEEIYQLQNNWEKVATYSRLGVFITLYKNPESD